MNLLYALFRNQPSTHIQLLINVILTIQSQPYFVAYKSVRTRTCRIFYSRRLLISFREACLEFESLQSVNSNIWKTMCSRDFERKQNFP
jgi:hypothetical protein